MPFLAANAVETLDGNLNLSNTGNLLFQHSILRAIYSPDNNYVAVQDQILSKEAISTINENFTALFLPFANAFRPSWKKQLNNWIENLRHINIPVIVCGIGAQCITDDPISELSSINGEVIEFCSLVLRNSSSIGVRGQLTASYLKNLGITEYDVIGCPSLFYFGNSLPNSNERSKKSDFRKISLNFSPQSPDKISDKYPQIDIALKLVEDFVKRHKEKDFYYFAQDTNELAHLLWNSERIVLKSLSKTLGMLPSYYPIDSHVWIENLKLFDLSLGTRLHGCIAGVLSGTPSLLLCHDSRTSEIATFFGLPHVDQAKLEKLDLDNIVDIINKAQLRSKFTENYKNFERFLKRNTSGFLQDFKFYCNIEEYDFNINSIDFPETINSLIYPSAKEINEKLNYLYKLFKR